jgi:hypothetical protein
MHRLATTCTLVLLLAQLAPQATGRVSEGHPHSNTPASSAPHKNGGRTSSTDGAAANAGVDTAVDVLVCVGYTLHSHLITFTRTASTCDARVCGHE